MTKRVLTSILTICITSLAFYGGAMVKHYVPPRKLALTMNVTPAALSDWATLSPDSDSVDATMLQMPLIFDSDNAPVADSAKKDAAGALTLNAGDQWLSDAIQDTERSRQIRREATIEHPENVAFNKDLLPEPPKQYVIAADPSTSKFKIQEVVPPPPVEIPLKDEPVKIHHWLHSFDGSLHFTQAYISKNWYQGGYINLSVLADIKW